MNRGRAVILNTITLVFLVLTLVVALGVLALLGRIVPVPGSLRSTTSTLPAVLMIPTDTTTPSPGPTLTPTQTSSPTRTASPLPPTTTPAPSQTPTAPPTMTSMPSNTPLPSQTPTQTPLVTGSPVLTKEPATRQSATPSKVPSRTKQPTPTKRAGRAGQPTPTPVSIQASATAAPGYPFVVKPGTPLLVANPDQATGCAFQGIAGQVLGLNNAAAFGLRVTISSDTGLSYSAITGSNTKFGEAGWLIQVDSKPSSLKYTVELRNPKGVPISDKVPITFPHTCKGNLAVIHFSQVRPF